MTEISERSGETVYSHVEYEYDSGGRLLRKTNYIYGDDSRETVGWHYEYSYDSSDHLVSGEYYSGDGGLEERCEYLPSE